MLPKIMSSLHVNLDNFKFWNSDLGQFSVIKNTLSTPTGSMPAANQMELMDSICKYPGLMSAIQAAGGIEGELLRRKIEFINLPNHEQKLLLSQNKALVRQLYDTFFTGIIDDQMKIEPRLYYKHNAHTFSRLRISRKCFVSNSKNSFMIYLYVWFNPFKDNSLHVTLKCADRYAPDKQRFYEHALYASSIVERMGLENSYFLHGTLLE